MQTRYLFVLIHIRNNGKVGAAKHVMPSRKFFYRLFQGSTSFVDLFFCHLCFMTVMLTYLLLAALWSSAVRTDPLALLCVVFLVFLSYSHIVSLVRCGMLPSSLLQKCVYDQKIPKSHTADQPTAPLERATEH